MIELQVDDKCQNCLDFSPTVDQIDITKFGDKSKQIIQKVYCRNKDVCDNIENYLRNEKSKY